MSSPVTNTGGINFQAALATGDIQTIIQMVQSERVRLLDSQLVDQVKAVQSRNDQIAKLNNALSALTAMQQFYGADDKKFLEGGAEKAFGNDFKGEKYQEFLQNYEAPLNKALSDAGLTNVGFSTTDTGHTFDDKGNLTKADPKGPGVWNGHVTKGEMDAAVTKIKGLIDAESNNQQMDMLRLQSLNNKKNESVELLTTTQKKHTDSASGIIRNF